MKSLIKSYDMNVHKAYIIRIKNNEKSETLAKRCADSCIKVNMKYEYWDAYNGISNPIEEPKHVNPIMKLFKLSDRYMLRGEVACFLSHLSLWIKCMELEKPIVILEHDAVMIKKYNTHKLFNSICYLGNDEQKNKGWQVLLTPPFGLAGINYFFICRAHAYAIDPTVARNMVSYVMKYGIGSSLDTILRADIFNVHQIGLYAYDVRDGIDDRDSTTILNRPEEGRPGIRNDNLLK
jgi:hypothetical protein